MATGSPLKDCCGVEFLWRVNPYSPPFGQSSATVRRFAADRPTTGIGEPAGVAATVCTGPDSPRLGYIADLF